MIPLLSVDVAVIGAGPAGLAAATAARQAGAERVAVFERLGEPGGILPQCIHNGFGLHVFQEELTGPEYAERFVVQAREAGVEFWLNSMVLSLSAERRLSVMSPQGLVHVEAARVVLAMGCRERTGPNILLGGARPAGVFTAGTAQRLVNVEGYLPGREVVIVGSGDIGLIMARRLTLEGARVKAVVELLPYPGGLARNVRQCLEDFGIPLRLAHATLSVEGRRRVSGVVIAPLDETGRPVLSRAEQIPCDTVLLSVGLIPENELSRQAGLELDPRTGGAAVDERGETSIPGIFACGNVLQVHDLVDYVTAEASAVGRWAGSSQASGSRELALVPGGNARYVVPQRLSAGLVPPFTISTRVQRPAGASVVRLGGVVIARRAVVRPAEMIRVDVKPGDWTKVLAEVGSEGCLRLEVEEERP
ncbi:MAG: FAD/NAD(P)-binding oxidoreductase [Bacillota bacterium]|nr:FAD/NAD(P)-binding oxidoreductase [Bacillota bacterium]